MHRKGISVPFPAQFVAQAETAGSKKYIWLNAIPAAGCEKEIMDHKTLIFQNHGLRGNVFQGNLAAVVKTTLG